MKKSIFIDLDGTVARFYDHADCLERMFNKNFFNRLEPYKNVVDGLRKLPNVCDVEEYSLSAINKAVWDMVLSEKKEWMATYMPNICLANQIYTCVGENKAQILNNMGIKISRNDYLLDDYNENLRQWEEAGGTAIKLVNDINDCGTSGSLWIGHRIRYDWTADRICQELEHIINGIDKNESSECVRTENDLEACAKEFASAMQAMFVRSPMAADIAALMTWFCNESRETDEEDVVYKIALHARDAVNTMDEPRFMAEDYIYAVIYDNESRTFSEWAGMSQDEFNKSAIEQLESHSYYNERSDK